MFRGRTVDPEMLRRLFDLRVRNSVIASACEARMRGLTVQDLVVKGSNTLVQEVVAEWWIPLIVRLEMYMSVLGFCPVIVSKRTMRAGKSYRKRFGEAAKSEYDVLVPSVPDFGTFNVSLDEMNDAGTFPVRVEMREDPERKVFVVRSNEFMGPLSHSGYVHSRVGVIADDYFSLQRMVRCAEVAAFNVCNPPVWVESHFGRDEQIGRVAQDIAAEGYMTGNPSERLAIHTRNESTHEIGALEEFDNVVEATLEGRNVDPRANVKLMQPHQRIAHQPPAPNVPTLAEMHARFEERVSTIFRVPSSMIASTHAAKREGAHQVDAQRYAEGVRSLRDEVVFALEQISLFVYEEKLQFDLPFRVGLNFEELALAYERGVLTSGSYKEEFSRLTGIGGLVKGRIRRRAPPV